MKYCRNCGKELNSDIQYCPNCGASVSEEQSGKNENSYQESNADGSLWESLVEFFKALIEYMKEAGLHIIDAIDKIIQMPPNIPKDSICPYCNSEDTFPIVKNETEIKTKGYSMGRGCCGMCLLGPFGLLCGALFTGSKVKSRSITWWGCKNCGRQAAYNSLLNDPRCSEWLPNLNFDFLEYEPKNSTVQNCFKLEMSASHLKTMCEQYCLVKQPRKMIFIADADVKEIRNSLGQKDAQYRSWGNNVYSFILPVPEIRQATPEICIEHYYSDNQIKMELKCGGIKRRLYMGCEFDTDGLSLDKKMFCNERNSCGNEKIRIIDGHEKSPRVYSIADENKTNVALSKMKFATSVLEKTPPFDEMDFSNFIPLFEIVKEILQQ